MKTRALWVSYEDTSYSFDYIAFDCGKLAEVFHLTDWQEFHTPTPAETAAVEELGVCSHAPYPYYALSKVRKLDLTDFEALCGKRSKAFGEHRDRLFDEFLRSQDAFLGFNLQDDIGKEYFPLAKASDEEIARIDVVGA